MRIGLTSGVFDLIHVGHLHYLERCRALCDKLIVGVDCDTLVRHAKGPQRPFTPELQRLQLIQSLACVDSAFLLRQIEDLDAMAQAFNVTSLFKHDGWANRDDIVGMEHGAKLVIVPDVSGLVSTTEIVKKIRGSAPLAALLAVGHSTVNLTPASFDTVTPKKTGDYWSCENCGQSGVEGPFGSASWHGPGSALCPVVDPFRVGDKRVVVTDFDGKKHDAVLKYVVPVMHECNDDPCRHRICAAVWETANGLRVWPIGNNWNRVEARGSA